MPARHRQVSTSTHGGAKVKHFVHWLVAGGVAAAPVMKSVMCGRIKNTSNIFCRTPPETEEGALKIGVKLGKGRTTVEMTICDKVSLCGYAARNGDCIDDAKGIVAVGSSLPWHFAPLVTAMNGRSSENMWLLVSPVFKEDSSP